MTDTLKVLVDLQAKFYQDLEQWQRLEMFPIWDYLQEVELNIQALDKLNRF